MNPSVPEPSHYLDQDSEQTLSEGLAEYYEKMPGLLTPEELSAEAQELFIPHDVCHVVFGCDTSIHNEALVDFWTMWGSTVGIKQYLHYLRNPQAQKIVEDAGLAKLSKATLRAVPDIVRVYARTRRMHKRWPWRNYGALMNRRLRDVRQEYGIRVIGR